MLLFLASLTCGFKQLCTFLKSFQHVVHLATCALSMAVYLREICKVCFHVLLFLASLTFGFKQFSTLLKSFPHMVHLHVFFCYIDWLECDGRIISDILYCQFHINIAPLLRPPGGPPRPLPNLVCCWYFVSFSNLSDPGLYNWARVWTPCQYLEIFSIIQLLECIIPLSVLMYTKIRITIPLTVFLAHG